VVTIEFDADGLPRVRDLAEQAAIGHGLGPGRAWDVKIIAGELAANSLRHGGGSGRLRLWDDEGHLVCEISDSGRLTDPLAGRRPPRADHLGGHGLLLVNHLADLVRLRTAAEGTTVQAYFARDSAR
jgi:anti-sigma regulatory factor (Ser/Thr protein kinase)